MSIERWSLPCTSSWFLGCTPFQHLPDHPSPFVGHDGFQSKASTSRAAAAPMLRVAETGVENDGMSGLIWRSSWTSASPVSMAWCGR